MKMDIQKCFILLLLNCFEEEETLDIVMYIIILAH